MVLYISIHHSIYPFMTPFLGIWSYTYTYTLLKSTMQLYNLVKYTFIHVFFCYSHVTYNILSHILILIYILIIPITMSKGHYKDVCTTGQCYTSPTMAPSDFLSCASIWDHPSRPLVGCAGSCARMAGVSQVSPWNIMCRCGVQRPLASFPDLRHRKWRFWPLHIVHGYDLISRLQKWCLRVTGRFLTHAMQRFFWKSVRHAFHGQCEGWHGVHMLQPPPLCDIWFLYGHDLHHPVWWNHISF